MALGWYVVIAMVVVGLVLLVASALAVLRRMRPLVAASVRAQRVAGPALAVRDKALALQRDSEALQRRLDGVSAGFVTALHRRDGGRRPAGGGKGGGAGAGGAEGWLGGQPRRHLIGGAVWRPPRGGGAPGGTRG